MEQWNNYWLEGHITSFSDRVNGNYNDKYNDFWKENLPSQNFNLLDIGSGNGAIPLLISQNLSNTEVKGMIIGCDRANVTLAGVLKNEEVDIRLDSGVNCENLPYESNYFTDVVSQYGIEYSNIEKSIKEVSRVLVVGGITKFLLHHENSLICNNARKTLNFVEYVFNIDYFDTLRSFINEMGEIKNKSDLNNLKYNSACENLRNDLNRKLNKLIKYDKIEFIEFEMDKIVKVMMSEYLYISLGEKLKLIHEFERKINQHKLRLKDLLSATIDTEKLSSLILNANSVNLYLQKVECLYNNNHDIIGWGIILRKF
jgi:ubiquinone/menaquinone biosynthesis C-methylase UbiE